MYANAVNKRLNMLGRFPSYRAFLMDSNKDFFCAIINASED
jgi:hypothetical protein